MIEQMESSEKESPISLVSSNNPKAKTEESESSEQLLTGKDIEQLNEIGTSLIGVQNVDDLLKLIVKKSRQILSADVSCLYLTVDTSKQKNQPTLLKFKLANYDTTSLNLFESYVDITEKNLLGYVATTNKTIRVNDINDQQEYPFEFHKILETQTMYPFKSVIAVPLISNKNKVIGVLTIWNKKKIRKIVLTFDNYQDYIIPFTSSDESLLKSIAGQASVAIENAKLYADINNLFDGFIRASVSAIEARDPTTYGHSERVAQLSLALGRELNEINTGPYKNFALNDQQLKELEYAALLHDFGKIGIRENILVKDKKLFPHEVQHVLDRVDLWKQSRLLELSHKKIDHLLREGKLDDELFHQLEREYHLQFREVDQALKFLHEINEPSLLNEEHLENLKILTELQFQRPSHGAHENILEQNDFLRLTIKQGSLSLKERKAIQAHVSFTYQFLNKIPWTEDLSKIPEIAHAHHEKIDGSGYPRGIKAELIPVPAKVMAVADVFDALVARDRPYKRAIPVLDALKILEDEGKQQKLDKDLVEIFTYRSIFRLTTG
jgi:HD-GYP domain-containing protein (c-di-GMP phosphodiesterase class II)